MVLASYDSVINALTTAGKSEKVFYHVTLTPAEGAGVPHFMWRGVGNAGISSSGSLPATGAGTVPTRTTAGALNIANPTNPDLSYFTKFGMGSNQTCSILLVDVLWFNSGLNGTLNTAQTINSSALTRYTTGDNVLPAVVCWTATGTTAAVNVTMSYTNQANTSGRTTQSVVFWTGGWGGGTVAPSADQIQGLPLQAGDTGVRSVQSLTLSATTGTAGNFGVMLYKPIAMLGVVANTYTERDLVLQTPGLIQKIDDACLQFILVPGAATAHTVYGVVECVEG